MQDHKLVSIIIVVLVLMFCAAYASVPIYRIFCKATGYGGTVKEYSEYKDIVGKRNITIRFNTDVDRDLDWEFRPLQQSMETLLGKKTLAYFEAENLSDYPIEGMAIYNVVPEKVGYYFNKVDCFCFSRQTLGPHQKVTLPVVFFVDPEIDNDPEITEKVSEITLSYTFYQYEK